MRLKAAVATVTIGSFSFASSAPAFAADQSRRVASTVASTHALTTADLHRAVQSSHEQANAVRNSLYELLARPDVKSQMSRIGISQETVASQVARLSDEELGRLQEQVMAADFQVTPAGLSTGAFVAITVAGALVLILAIILVLSDWSAESRATDRDGPHAGPWPRRAAAGRDATKGLPA